MRWRRPTGRPPSLRRRPPRRARRPAEFAPAPRPRTDAAQRGVRFRPGATATDSPKGDTPMNRQSRSFGGLLLRAGAATALALPAGDVLAGGPPPGIPSGVMPWEYYKYEGDRHGWESQPATPPPAVVTHSPQAYTVQVTVPPDERREVAVLLAQPPEDTSPSPSAPAAAADTLAHITVRVPADARVRFDGAPTT